MEPASAFSAPRYKQRTIVFLLVVWALASFFVFFWRLGSSAIPNWDEGKHAIVTHEMRASGDWLTLTFLGSDYFRKPPLSFWVRGAAENAFGESEWTIRLPSALAGLGTAFVLGLWAWQWRRRLADVNFTLLVFLTSRFAVYHVFRTGEPDGLLGLFLMLALYCFWRSLRDPRWLIWGSLVTGLAVMTKSVSGLAAALAWVAALLWLRRWPYRISHVLLAAAVFLAIVIPWHAVEFFRHGQRFLGDYFGLDVVERATVRLAGSPEGHGLLWYFGVLFRDLFPWGGFLLPASAFALRQAWQGRDDNTRTLRVILVAVVVPFVAYSLAATKLDWYILPTDLAACLLLGWLGSSLLEGRLPQWVSVLAIAVLAVTLAALAGFFPMGNFSFAALRAWASHPTELTHARLWTLAAAAVSVAAVLLRWRRLITTRTAVATCLFVLAVTSAVFTVRRTNTVTENPYRVFARAAGIRATPVTIVSYDVKNRVDKALRYYLITLPNGTYAYARSNPDALAKYPAGTYVVAQAKTQLPTPDRFERLAVSRGLAFYRIR